MFQWFSANWGGGGGGKKKIKIFFYIQKKKKNQNKKYETRSSSTDLVLVRTTMRNNGARHAPYNRFRDHHSIGMRGQRQSQGQRTRVSALHEQCVHYPDAGPTLSHVRIIIVTPRTDAS